MKLSKKCRYGTRAMIEIARQWGGDPVKRKEIAKSQDLSMGFLENILVVLKESGLIRTVRGARGGFALAGPPEKTLLIDIVNALEGTTAPVDCLSDPTICTRVPTCSARRVWKKVHEAQNGVLSNLSLQDLLDRERHGRGSYSYSI